MIVLAELVLSPIALDTILIMSILLGIIGPLYLAYDLFGRENGPLRKVRVAESKDDGVTWGSVGATDLPNPGSGLDAVALENDHWVLFAKEEGVAGGIHETARGCECRCKEELRVRRPPRVRRVRGRCGTPARQ